MNTLRTELALWVTLFALACSGAVTNEPPLKRDLESAWTIQRFRDQFPSAPAGCLTLWVESLDGCAVSTTDDPEPRQCVASSEAFILRSRAKPDDELCEFGMNLACDCENQRLEEQ